MKIKSDRIDSNFFVSNHELGREKSEMYFPCGQTGLRAMSHQHLMKLLMREVKGQFLRNANKTSKNLFS